MPIMGAACSIVPTWFALLILTAVIGIRYSLLTRILSNKYPGIWQIRLGCVSVCVSVFVSLGVYNTRRISFAEFMAYLLLL